MFPKYSSVDKADHDDNTDDLSGLKNWDKIVDDSNSKQEY